MPPENEPGVAEDSVASELTDSDILSELAAFKSGEEKTEEVAEKEIEKTEPEGADEVDSDDGDGDEDDEDDDEDNSDDEKASGGLKGLSKIKAAEKSFNKRMKAQKAELQADKDTWLKRVEAAEKIANNQSTYKTLANSNPVALFEDFGIEGPEAFQALGKYFFQYGKGIAPDAKPADKQAAESIKRLREQSAGLQQTQSKIAELEKKLEAKDQAASHAREIQAFQAKLGRIASKKFPLAAKILSSKAKEEAQERLIEIAREIARRDPGVEPSARKVLKRYEADERRRLEARGIDVDAFTAAIKTKKTNPEKAAKSKSVPKPTNENNSSDDDDLSPEEQILRELKEARERGEVA